MIPYSLRENRDRDQGIDIDMVDWDLAGTLQLVHSAQKGEVAARDQLFRRYLPRVRQIVAVRARISLRDLDEHEDIVQESLLKVFQGLRRIDKDTEAAFRNWVACCVE